MDEDLYVGNRLLSTLRVVDLKDELMIRHLPKSGSKSDLIERLRSAILKEQVAVPAVQSIQSHLTLPNIGLPDDPSLPATQPPIIINPATLPPAPSQINDVHHIAAASSSLETDPRFQSTQRAGVISQAMPAIFQPSEEYHVRVADGSSSAEKRTAINKPSDSVVDPVVKTSTEAVPEKPVVDGIPSKPEVEAVTATPVVEAVTTTPVVESVMAMPVVETVPDKPVVEEAPAKCQDIAENSSESDQKDSEKAGEAIKNDVTPTAELITDKAADIEDSSSQEEVDTRRSRSRSKSNSSSRSKSSSSSSSSDGSRSRSNSSSSGSGDDDNEKSKETNRTHSPQTQKKEDEDSEHQKTELPKLAAETSADSQQLKAEGNEAPGDGAAVQKTTDIVSNEKQETTETAIPSDDKVDDTSDSKMEVDPVAKDEKSNESIKESKVTNEEVSKENIKPKEPPKPVKMPRRIHLGSKPKTNDADASGSNATDTSRKSSWGSRHKTAKQSSITISSDILKDLIPKPSTPTEDVKNDKDEATQKEESKDTDESKESKEQAAEQEVDKKGEDAEVRRKIVIVKDDTSEGTDVPKEEVEKDKDLASPPAKRKFVEKDIPVDKIAVTRKTPTTVIDKPVRTRSPSPPRHPESNIIHVRGLVRPFTQKQLKDLLSKTGTLVEEDFWIDGIKSHCIVTYKTVEEAAAARKELHNITWPSCNTKVLKVDFTTTEELNRHKGILVPSKEGQKSKSEAKKDKRRVSAPGDSESKRKRTPSRDKKSSEQNHVDRRASPKRDSEKVKRAATPPVREWDRGKVRDMSPRRSPGPRERRERRRSRSPRRSRERRLSDNRMRERSPMLKRKREREEQVEKKKEAPAKLLDELFRKTNASPSIYWLPLTEEQSVARKAEMDRRLAEREHAREAEGHMMRRRSRERSGGGRYRDRGYRRSRS